MSDPVLPPSASAPPSTPLDLAEKTFPTRFFNGYDPKSVHDYLVSLGRNWEEILLSAQKLNLAASLERERATGDRPYDVFGEDLARILAEAHTQADAMRREAILELQRAQTDADQARATAHAEAEDIVATATKAGEDLRVTAQMEADQLRMDARNEAADLVADAYADKERLETSNADLRRQLESLLADMSPLLTRIPARQVPPAPVAPEPVPDLVQEPEPVPEVMEASPVSEPDPEPEPEPRAASGSSVVQGDTSVLVRPEVDPEETQVIHQETPASQQGPLPIEVPEVAAPEHAGATAMEDTSGHRSEGLFDDLLKPRESRGNRRRARR